MAEILTGPFSQYGRDDNEKKRRRPKLLIFGALVLCIALIIIIVLSRWKFNSYQIRYVDRNEYVLAYDYYCFDEFVLKAASDSAACVSETNEQYWTVTYDMTKPMVVTAGKNAAIYDLNGTDIVLCTTKGLSAKIRTSSPVLRLAISKNGYAAAITDDGTDAIVEYYDSKGQKISSIKTTMDTTGYPYDVAIDEDGTVLAVAYIAFEDSQMTSRIRFYNFSQAGSDREDNIINTYAYTGTLIPMIEYIGSDTFAGFADEGVYLYSGREKPEQKKYVESKGNIISALANEGYFGFIVNDSATGRNTLKVYSPSGRVKGSFEVKIAYTAISEGYSDIVLYNRNQMAVYSLNGVRRYEADTDELIRQITTLGNNRYIMISEEEYKLISLA